MLINMIALTSDKDDLKHHGPLPYEWREFYNLLSLAVE